MGALDGKVAIITGAATGIGRASAVLFGKAGAHLVLADAREKELAETLTVVGGSTVSVVGDLADPAACARVVERALEAFGRLDVLFNNAGVGTMVVGGTVETID